ncbi:MAG: hypothetical protein IJ470_03965 [Clostridia bacterium]|nr:hypothetical protein [Clostridia bacterium]
MKKKYIIPFLYENEPAVSYEAIAATESGSNGAEWVWGDDLVPEDQ